MKRYFFSIKWPLLIQTGETDTISFYIEQNMCSNFKKHRGRAGQWCRYDDASPCGYRLIYDGPGLINGNEGQIPHHPQTPQHSQRLLNIPTTVGCRRALIIVSCAPRTIQSSITKMRASNRPLKTFRPFKIVQLTPRMSPSFLPRWGNEKKKLDPFNVDSKRRLHDFMYPHWRWNFL